MAERAQGFRQIFTFINMGLQHLLGEALDAISGARSGQGVRGRRELPGGPIHLGS